MASTITNTTKMANRYGLNLKFYTYDGSAPEASDTPVATIDFANEASLELSSDISWATGGQAHSKMIGFPNAIEGTFSLSSQVNTLALLAIASGNTITTLNKKVEFKNATSGSATPKYYTITGDTVWVDENGKTYSEKLTIYKALVKPGYSVTYSGDGDPQSITVEFELAATPDGNVVDIERDDTAA